MTTGVEEEEVVVVVGDVDCGDDVAVGVDGTSCLLDVEADVDVAELGLDPTAPPVAPVLLRGVLLLLPLPLLLASAVRVAILGDAFDNLDALLF